MQGSPVAVKGNSGLSQICRAGSDPSGPVWLLRRPSRWWDEVGGGVVDFCRFVATRGGIRSTVGWRVLAGGAAACPGARVLELMRI